MPKIKSTSSSAVVKKPRATKKSAPKTVKSPKKVKAILVDVIEDEPLENFSTENYKQADKVSLEEIDQQKKFYSKLASEIKKPAPESKKKTETKSDTPGRRVGLYRHFKRSNGTGQFRPTC